MKTSSRLYRSYYRLARFFIGLFCRFSVSGAAYIPEGAALVCGNHSSNLDPFLVAFALGIHNHAHIIAKAELYKIPVVSSILRKLEMIRVDRGISDLAAVKDSLRYLKNGEKVVIFPEGTRVSEDDAASAKIGAIKLAERASVPILPVFIPRKKPLFRRISIVIGESYVLEKQDKKRTPDDYERLTVDLMERIKSLGSVKCES